MLSLLYHRSTSRTAIAISRMLGLHRTRVPIEGDLIVIRWGSSSPAVDKAINTRSSIALAAHGANSIGALADAGVPTIELYPTPPAEPNLYPILGRRVHHRAGLDILWAETPAQALSMPRPFFTRFVQMDKELRVHVFGGEALRVFRKVPRTCDADLRIKTSLRGWGYHIVNHRNNYRKAQSIAVDALEALGLAFGAVDIGWNESERRYYVFEVNTGPALNSITLLHYCAKFEEYLCRLEVGYVPTGVHWTREIDSRTNRGNDDE